MHPKASAGAALELESPQTNIPIDADSWASCPPSFTARSPLDERALRLAPPNFQHEIRGFTSGPFLPTATQLRARTGLTWRAKHQH
jgi:hypothetical protein